MDIEKSDVEWFITLIVMILLSIKPAKKGVKHSKKRKRKKHKH